MLPSISPLSTTIIEVLFEYGALPLRQLTECLIRGKINVSRQAIHKSICQLESLQITYRVNRKLALSLYWIDKLSSRLDVAKLTARRALVQSFRGSSGTRRTCVAKFKVKSLKELIPLWSQVVVTLTSWEKDKIILEQVEHAWFHLANNIFERQLLDHIQHHNWRYFLIVLKKSPLSTSYERFVREQSCRIRYRPEGVDEKTSPYFSLVGSYVISVRLHPLVQRELDELALLTRQELLQQLHRVSRVLDTRQVCELKIVLDPRYAARLRQKFEVVFSLRK